MGPATSLVNSAESSTSTNGLPRDGPAMVNSVIPHCSAGPFPYPIDAPPSRRAVAAGCGVTGLGMRSLLGGQERPPFAPAFFLPDGVGNRGGQQQPLGVRIARVRRHLVPVAVFDDLAVVHHGDPV